MLKDFSTFSNRHTAFRRAMCVVVLMAFSVGSQGCAGYNYRVQLAKPKPANEYERKTINCYFWGLMPEKPVVAESCGTNGLDEVHIQTNVGYILVGFFSLGIWVPLDIEWKCTKQPMIITPPHP